VKRRRGKNLDFLTFISFIIIFFLSLGRKDIEEERKGREGG